MTRHDFELIASAMADAHAQIEGTAYIQDKLAAFAGHRIACKQLADTLNTINPRFSRERFLTACTGAQYD